jgi:hypothetical protein
VAITIQISERSGAAFLEILRKERDDLKSLLADKEREIEQLETQLSKPSSRQTQDEPRERAPRGMPKNSILSALPSYGAAGVTISELSRSLRIPYSSAHRAIGELESDHKIEQKDNKWRILSEEERA